MDDEQIKQIEFETEVMSFQSMKVVTLLIAFFNRNPNDVLTDGDFLSIQKVAWKETKEEYQLKDDFFPDKVK